MGAAVGHAEQVCCPESRAARQASGGANGADPELQAEIARRLMALQSRSSGLLEEGWPARPSRPPPQRPAPRPRPTCAESPPYGDSGGGREYGLAAEHAPGKNGSARSSVSKAGPDDLGQPRTLAEGVELYTKKGEDFSFKYSVRNRKLAKLRFTLSLDGSTNVACPEWGGSQLETTVEVPAKGLVTIGTARRVDDEQAASLKTRFAWQHLPLSRRETEPLLKSFDREIAIQLHAMRELGLDRACAVEDIQARCRAGGLLFTDPTFPPSQASLWYDREAAAERPPVIWKRPRDIPLESGGGIEPTWCIFKDPSRLAERSHAQDIEQGALGDCWYLAALGALAEYPDLLARIFGKPPRAALGRTIATEVGVYQLRCWKNGHETTVIVDDWFPCDPDSGRPCYSHAHENQLWVMLLEKAWAKLHGSYQDLEAGLAYQAIMDLTGKPGWFYSIQDYAPQVRSGEFFAMLLDFHKLGYIMAAATPGRDELSKNRGAAARSGLVPGHAYSVREVAEVCGQQLVRLRNPWGNFEWDGAWSESDPRWTEEMKSLVAYSPHPNDGMFWMSAEDFCFHFCAVHVVYHKHEFPWTEIREVVGLGKAESSLAGVFDFEVPHETSGYVTLWQVDERIRGACPNVRAAFAMFGPLGEETEAEVLRTPFWAMREIVQELPTIQPGTYRVGVWCAPGDDGEAPPEGYTAVLMLSLSPPPVHGYRVRRGSGILVRRSLASGLHEVVPWARPLTPDLRQALVCLAVIHREDREECDKSTLSLTTAWLPNGGFGVVAKSKVQDELELKVDFSPSKGLQLFGKGQSMVATLTLGPGEGPRLVAELVPVGDGARSAMWSFSARGSRLE